MLPALVQHWELFDWLSIPLAWRATGPSQLFPIVMGVLKLEPVDPGASRLT